jgi:hypothetical protein
VKFNGWVCIPHNADADHDWRIMSDSCGDAGVVNGTMTFYWWECEQCGHVDEYREVTSHDLSADEEDYW